MNQTFKNWIQLINQKIKHNLKQFKNKKLKKLTPKSCGHNSVPRHHFQRFTIILGSVDTIVYPHTNQNPTLSINPRSEARTSTLGAVASLGASVPCPSGWGGLGLVTFAGDECGCYHGGATSPDRLTDCLLMYGSATLQSPTSICQEMPPEETLACCLDRFALLMFRIA